MCILVSITVIGLVRFPEDAIQGLNQSAENVELHDNSRITTGSGYKTVWCPRTVHKIIGHLDWSCWKLKSKIIEEEEMYLVERTQNNRFSDGKDKLIFNSDIGNPLHNPQQWRHVVGVVDGLFYHLDNEDMKLFRYPISILNGTEDRTPNKTNLNYFIYLIKY